MDIFSDELWSLNTDNRVYEDSDECFLHNGWCTHCMGPRPEEPEYDSTDEDEVLELIVPNIR